MLKLDNSSEFPVGKGEARENDATENNMFKRRIREAIEIRSRKPSLKTDISFHVTPVAKVVEFFLHLL